MAKNKKFTSANRNARVRTRQDKTGKLRTETTARDNGAFDVAISTNTRTNSTRCFLDLDGRVGNFPWPSVELNGREARTLYRTLKKHFESQGKFIY